MYTYINDKMATRSSLQADGCFEMDDLVEITQGAKR